MTQPDPIVLDLDPSQYIAGLGQADQATDSFTSGLRSTTAAMNPVQRAMGLITPPRAALVGLTGLVSAAGSVQEQLAGMSATAKVTHANMGVLAAGMRQLARDMPLGNTGARELTMTLTRLGVASQGSERTVGSLSKTFARLGGATGEGPGQLAAGFIQLNRSMGTGFNPQRMEKLADSLVTVSAQSGASATGILQFSKAIAPMAHASGIGETKVLGISAAFSKLGDDGLGAATAFNKMLGDMNRSVREGSPDMAAYASIVGKTTAGFQALFKANPAEAITQVTEAIAKSGPQGQHQLEQLGLDGVRTQRYLQEVSAAGGLRETVGQAQTGYGSGNARKAADQAFSTLQSSATRLGAVSEQLVDALGAPLLGAVTLFTNTLHHAAMPIAGIAGSTPVQDLMKIAVAAAVPLLIGSKLIGSGGTAAMGVQALTSGPLRALMAGFARGRGGAGYEGGYFTRGFLRRVDEGEALASRQGTNEMAQRLYARSMGVGEAFARTPGPNASMAAQLRNATGAGVGAMLRLQAEQMRLARTNFSERSLQMAPYGAPYRDFSQRRHEVHDAFADNQITKAERDQMLADNRARLLDRARNQGLGTGIGQAGLGLGAVAYETTRFGASMAGRAVGAVGKQLGVVGVGMLGYELYSHQKAMRDQQNEAATNSTSFIDDYRVAMGKATDATQTFAGRMQATADSMAASVTTMAEALKVTPERVRAANMVQHPAATYAGTVSGVAAQLRLQRTTQGIAPDEMARISMDLINQYGQQTAQQILSQVGNGTSDPMSDIQGAVRGISQGPKRGGILGAMANHFDIISALTPNRTKNSADFTISSMSDAQTKGVQSIGAELVAQRAKDQTMGPDYANKQLADRMNTAVNTALEEGNTDLVNTLIQSFQGKFDKGGFQGKISIKDLQKAGSFTAAQSALSDAFRQNMAYANGGAAVIGTPFEVQRAAGTGGERLFGQGMGPDTFGRARTELTSYMTQGTASPSAQTAAVSAAIAAYTSSGQSLEHVADVASTLASHFDDVTGAANQFAMALQQTAMAAIQARPTVVTQGSMAATMATRYAHNAGISPTNTADAQLRAAGIAGLQDVENQTKSALTNRLAAQREFQVSSVRSQQDYQLQLTYANADYHRQVTRSQDAFQLQLDRSDRDFKRSQLHSEQDFNRQRGYLIEDASRSAYSAYQRMAVQPTWDSSNLLGNINEQSQALQAQIDNMAKLRRGGVNTNAIKLLDLNNPQNAQQLASLVGDMANDPRVAHALNAAAAKRQQLGEKLTQDPANTSLARQDKEFAISMGRTREQYNTTISDMRKNQSIAMSQAAQDHNTATSRMAEANTKMIKRAGEDLARADQEIVGNLDKLSEALNKAVNGHFVDFSRLTQSSMGKWAELAKKFSTDWKTLVQGLTVTATFTTNADGTAKDSELAGHPGSGVPTKPAPKRGADAPSQSGGHFYPNTSMGPVKHAAGGILYAPTMIGPHDQAGEAGPEAVIPLDHRGATVLAEAMHQFVSRDQARLMSAAAAASYITYDSSTHYTDSGVTVEKLEVHGVSLDDALAQGQVLTRRRNLTSAPQARR